MSAIPGVLMIIVVCIATWMRRGRRVALVHTIPLLALFAVWAVVWIGYEQTPINPGTPDVGTLSAFIVNGFRGTFGDLGWWPGVGVALATLTVLGVVVSTRSGSPAEWLHRVSGPLALFVGGVLFIASAGFERAAAYGPDFAYQSRYLYMVTAFSLPLIAFAGQAVSDRWPLSTAIVVLLPIIGMPANAAAADTPIPYLAPTRDLILTLPRVPISKAAAADVVPGVRYAPVDYSIGFLRDAMADGKLPEPASLDPATVARATVDIALGQREDLPNRPCQPVSTPADLHLQPGDEIHLGTDPVPLTVVTDAGPQTATVDPAHGRTLQAQVPDLHVTAPPDAAGHLQVSVSQCRCEAPVYAQRAAGNWGASCIAELPKEPQKRCGEIRGGSGGG
jgi:hypothetical protein